MASHYAKRTVTVSGDVLEVIQYRQGCTWTSPSNGQQHQTAEGAMACEVVSYLRSCGEQVEYDSPEVAAIVAQVE